jgi:hypothetical protein
MSFYSLDAHSRFTSVPERVFFSALLWALNNVIHSILRLLYIVSFFFVINFCIHYLHVGLVSKLSWQLEEWEDRASRCLLRKSQYRSR